MTNQALLESVLGSTPPHPPTPPPHPLIFCSSPGFKWLGNVAAKLEREGYTVLFAYEEAIGFMFNKIHKVGGLGWGVVRGVG